MNKKGFTLIELLAVVILLSLIIVLALPKITNSVNNKRKEIDEVTKNLIESAAKLYVSDNKTSFPKSEENTYCITLNTLIENEYLKGSIKYNNKDITNSKVVKLTYNDGFNYELVNKNSCEKAIPAPKSFAEDSWETIVANVRSGNLSAYHVGDRKEIALTGFTNTEADSNGLYTIRIANTSNEGDVCTKEYLEKADGSKEKYSKTACGFVIEFEDIITTHVMNPKGEYKGTQHDFGWNIDGWPASSMRTYVNNDIYNALPEGLRNVIIPTTVVSGYGLDDAPNKVSTDELYLLSTGEVWDQGTSYDTARELTRQLDYYKEYKNEDGSIGVTESHYSGAIKKLNGSASYWWLRSANSIYTNSFYTVSSSGDWFNNGSYITYGVAVAFRIG